MCVCVVDMSETDVCVRGRYEHLYVCVCVVVGQGVCKGGGA